MWHRRSVQLSDYILAMIERFNGNLAENQMSVFEALHESAAHSIIEEPCSELQGISQM